jgi:hypothetical protein
MRDEQYTPNVLFDHSGENAEPTEVDHTDGGKYRMLREGEVIHSGDQYDDGCATLAWSDAWCFAGQRVHEHSIRLFRRPVPQTEEADPSEADPTEGGKYRILELGELIEFQDEFMYASGWASAYRVGCPVYEVGDYRRPVKQTTEPQVEQPATTQTPFRSAPTSPTDVAEELANWIYDLQREIVERADERGKLKHKLAALLTLDSPVAFMTPENEVLCVAKTMMADGSVSVDVVFVPWG